MLNIGDEYWYGINLCKKQKSEPLGNSLQKAKIP